MLATRGCSSQGDGIGEIRSGWSRVLRTPSRPRQCITTRNDMTSKRWLDLSEYRPDIYVDVKLMCEEVAGIGGDGQSRHSRAADWRMDHTTPSDPRRAAAIPCRPQASQA